MRGHLEQSNNDNLFQKHCSFYLKDPLPCITFYLVWLAGKDLKKSCNVSTYVYHIMNG